MQGTLFGEQEPKTVQPKHSNSALQSVSDVSNVIVFPWGQYSGKSVEQVAVNDYAYLRWLEKENKMGERALRERIQKVLYNLNNFVSPLKCKEEGCNKTAENLTIAITNGMIPRGGNKRVSGPTGISVSTQYIWCKEHASPQLYNKAEPYEIKFDTILVMPRFPQWVRKDVTEALLQCTGFTGNRTKQSLADLVDNLVLK